METCGRDGKWKKERQEGAGAYELKVCTYREITGEYDDGCGGVTFLVFTVMQCSEVCI